MMFLIGNAVMLSLIHIDVVPISNTAHILIIFGLFISAISIPIGMLYVKIDYSYQVPVTGPSWLVDARNFEEYFKNFFVDLYHEYSTKIGRGFYLFANCCMVALLIYEIKLRYVKEISDFLIYLAITVMIVTFVICVLFNSTQRKGTR